MIYVLRWVFIILATIGGMTVSFWFFYGVTSMILKIRNKRYQKIMRYEKERGK